jgi:diguanylate cyclase (GGDEF)-like protein
VLDVQPAGLPAEDRESVAAQYRRVTAHLSVALVLLVGVTLYLVTNDGRVIWSTTGRNLADLSVALQSSASRTLVESTTELDAVGRQLSGTRGSASDIREALQDANRFDPGDTYLGVIDLGAGNATVVSRADGSVSDAVVARLRGTLRAPRTVGRLQDFLQLPDDPNWYLPVTSQVHTGSGASLVVFSLVPLPYLLAGAQSLQLVHDSAVTLVADDGTVLLTYVPATHAARLNGWKVDGALMERARRNLSGVMTVTGRRDHRHYLVGYSHSSVVPIYVAARVPWRSIGAAWLRQALTPLLVLLFGMAAILAFGWTLRRTLRRQQDYMARHEHLATHDSLTGLINRVEFMETLERRISVDGAGPLAVVLLDLNRFKDINDTLGHAAGDQVLAESSRRLESMFVGTETRVARLGGDELALVVPGDCEPDLMDSLCRRVLTQLGATQHVRSVQLNMTASMGIALYPEDAVTPNELLRCADIALYSAKADLRTHCRYRPVMDSFTAATLSMQSDFAKALQEGSLTVAYQPKVRLRDGELIGLEALARWWHPVHGQVPPSQFVHLAESTELIHPFMRHILRTVACQMRRWLQDDIRIPVSLNMSANNLLDQGFVEYLDAVLREFGVPPALLELEVTESAVMRLPETILERLHAVRALGVTLSIDDFGTGYATLAYLKQLPVQQLKIDKSFIVNLLGDSADQRIVRSAVQLAHGFGLTVVAEGVECAAVAEQLRLYGCDYAQGYHFGRPVAAAQIAEQWLADALE